PHCHFQALPESILHFKHLNSLDLTNNELQDLPLEMSQLEDLRNIYLNDNQFQDYPAVLACFNNLEDGFDLNLSEVNEAFRNAEYYDIEAYVRMRYRLITWNKEAFLHDIEIARNVWMDAAIPQLLNIENEIEERLCKLESISGLPVEEFKEKMQKINSHISYSAFKYNKPSKLIDYIDDIRRVIRDLKSLRTMEIHLNRKIPYLISSDDPIGYNIQADSGGINYLQMENLHLQEIPKEIFIMKDLLYLSLKNNPITSLPKDILDLQYLMRLDISQTEIHEFPLILFQWNDDLKVTYDELSISDLDRELFEKFNSGKLKEFVKDKYEKWAQEEFLRRLSQNKAATSIDKSYPKLIQIRPQLETKVKKLKTPAATEFLKYLREITEIQLTNSKYSIFL
ncbi:MAG: hypothetical protein ACTSRK_21020, partial [Promethearchaeota archaeon]